MKKILKTFSALGTLTIVVAPLASIVACNEKNNKFSAVTIKESTKSDEEILNEMVVSTYGSKVLNNEEKLPVVKDIIDDFAKAGTYNYTLDPKGWGTPEQQADMKKARDGVEKLWNTPQGEVIRLAHITTRMGVTMWDIHPTRASDAVVLGITQGINAAGFKIDEKLNLFKFKLINNVREALEATGARESLKKFEGFVEWMLSPENDYANLKLTLMGGDINEDFMYGVQNSLNFNSDAQAAQKYLEIFTLNNKAQQKVASLTPEQAQWIKDIKHSKELASTATSKAVAVKKIFEDTPEADLAFANQLIGESIGPSLRTAIVSAALGAIWNIPGDVAAKNFKRAALSAVGVEVGSAIEAKLTAEERTHLGTLDEFIKFINDIKSPDNKYKFIKDLFEKADAKEPQIKALQARLNEGTYPGGTLQPLLPSGATKVDIYA